MKHTYKVLISEKSYLRVKLRAMRLSGTFIDEIYYNKKDLLFRTRSGTDPRLTWFQTIRITDLEKLEEISKTKDLDRVIRESGIKVHCTCLQSGTFIKTKNGDKPIQLITNNDYVLSSDGRYHRVIKVLCSLKKEWIDLFLSNGKFLSLTGEHRVRYNNGEKVTVKEAKNIKVGDNLVELKNITIYQGSTQWLDNYKNVEVVSVTKRIGQDRFFDICLADKPHDYIANGVVVKNCPAFLYWGFKAMAWKNGYGLEKELRMPRVRNPHQQGYVCSTGETLILTENGYVPIVDIKEGDLVYTHKGRLRRVTHKFEFESDDLYKVRFSKEKSFNVTGTHKFLAFKPQTQKRTLKAQGVIKPKYETVNNLENGDYLTRARLNLNQDIFVGNGEAFLAGMFLADGSLSYYRCKGKSTRVLYKDDIYFNCIEISFAWDRLEYFKSLMSKEGIRVDKFYKNSARDNDGAMFIRDSKLIEFVHRNCNFTSKRFNEEKNPSLDILRWNKEAKESFLRGFFAGDGSISNSEVVILNSNRRIIAILLQLLMNDYEVSFYNKSIEGYKNCLSLQITGSDANLLKDKFRDLIELKGIKSKIKDSTKSRLVQDGFSYISINEKKKIEGTFKVYTMEVEEDHSYLMESGIVSSNCKHLYQCCMVYPFISKTVAMKMKRYFKPIDDKKEKERQEQEERDKKFKEKFGNAQGDNNGNV